MRTIVIVRCPARHLGESVRAGKTWRGSDWSRKLIEHTELNDGSLLVEITEPLENTFELTLVGSEAA